MANATGTVTTIMHDTVDLGRAARFWSTLLGLEEMYRDERYVYLSKLSPDGPHLGFQLVPEELAAKNRLHLDIRVPDREATVAQVQAMGGSHVRDHQEGDFPLWSIMKDPEGHEFCIYEAQIDDA